MYYIDLRKAEIADIEKEDTKLFGVFFLLFIWYNKSIDKYNKAKGANNDNKEI